MAHTYSQTIGEQQACAVSFNLPISTKHGMEVCKSLKGKLLPKATAFLQNVMECKIAVPYTKYHFDLGHKKGMGPGRFPVITCKHLLGVLKNAEANAQAKGLNTSTLIVQHAVCNTGPTVWRYGRKRRRQAKRAHVEIIIGEKQK